MNYYVSFPAKVRERIRENDVVINLTDATSEEASLIEIEDIFVFSDGEESRIKSVKYC